MVIFTEGYDFKIPTKFKIEIMALIENKATATNVFRKLVKFFIKDKHEWVERSTKIMFENFPVINACIGK